MKTSVNRRRFLGSALASGAFTIVPRHVLGGAGYVAPSDKITLAHIGMGTQGFRELGGLLADPRIQIVAVCDPNTDSNDYVEWGKNEHPQHASERTWESPPGERTTAAVPAAARWAGKSSTPTTPTSGARRSSRPAPPTPTSANCWRRRRTWTPSRS